MTDMTRWWTYQRERFPLTVNGPLVGVFSLGALFHSALLRDAPDTVDWRAGVVAVVVTLGFFLLLRIADEFKDAEKDAQYRPYRPVPRGLVTLRELGMLGVGTAGIQLGLTVWLDPTITWILVLTWVYFGLMSVEFFVPTWLEPRLGLYAASHMIILPLIALLASSGDWAVAGAEPPTSIGWFLAATYANGLVLEIGRKIRSPDGEEDGVRTYSKQWGRTAAITVWITCIASAGLLSVVAAGQVGAATWGGALIGGAGITGGIVSLRFLRAPTSARARHVEVAAGLWLLVSFGAMGLLPLVV